MYLNRDSACKGMAYFYSTKRICYFFEKKKIPRFTTGYLQR